MRCISNENKISRQFWHKDNPDFYELKRILKLKKNKEISEYQLNLRFSGL
jgi:hypothetical protein